MNKGIKGNLKEEIFNVVNENVKALERLFPSVVKDGQVDFEALKEELGEFKEVDAEKYGLTWSGKQNAKKIAQQDISGKTLKYVPEDSKHPDTTENLYIEGDNLEVLKLLRQSYYGAIKMIYIDPPYNTGNDFVYNDNFSMDKGQSDIEEGNVSELGERYTVNSKSSNKYHANWLNMMYPRLKVAKDLLTDDGVILISIDEYEVHNLKKVCDEIFGEINFIGEVPRKTKSSTNDTSNNFNNQHDYILLYGKSELCCLKGVKKDFSNYKNLDNDINGPWKSTDPSAKSGGQGTYFEIVNIYTGKIDLPPKGRYWAFNKESFKEYVKNGKITFKKEHSPNERGFIFKTYLNQLLSFYKPVDSLIFQDNMYMNQIATKELNNMNIDFEYSKPTNLLVNLLKYCGDDNSIILDFFSGSSTTAHSVMKLNADDNGSRKFIMVQLQEKTDIKSEVYKNGYKTICEIGKERIRRAGEKIKEENKDKEGIENLDIGFKVFKVDDTNIRWNYENEDLKTLSNIAIKDKEEEATFDFIAATEMQFDLDEVISPKDRLDFMPGTKDIDVVYEILLRQRDIPLSSKVELLEDIGTRTYIFADSYVVCLETEITEELIEKLAAINPLPIKYILRDSAFGDDIELKDLSDRRLQALIERNTGESKKVYTIEFI